MSTGEPAPTSTAVLFTVAEAWKQPGCPSVGVDEHAVPCPYRGRCGATARNGPSSHEENGGPDVQVTTWGSQAVMATYCGTPSRGRLDKAEVGDSEDEGPGDGGGGTVSAQRSFRAMTGLCLIP